MRTRCFTDSEERRAAGRSRRTDLQIFSGLRCWTVSTRRRIFAPIAKREDVDVTIACEALAEKLRIWSFIDSIRPDAPLSLKEVSAVFEAEVLRFPGAIADLWMSGIRDREREAPSEPHSTSSQSGALWVYSPPVGASDSGRLIRLAPTGGIPSSAGMVQDHVGHCPTDEVGEGSDQADPIACLIAVASRGEVDAGPRLHAFLAQSPRVVPRGSPCRVLEKIYAGVIPPHLACDRLQGAYFVQRSGAGPELPSLEALLARPGFVGRVEPVRPATDKKMRARGEIFDVESVIFTRPGYAGRINYSANTGTLVDAEIVFRGQ